MVARNLTFPEIIVVIQIICDIGNIGTFVTHEISDLAVFKFETVDFHIG